MANAVIVIDMVVGFLEPEHNLYFRQAREIIPNVQTLLERESTAGSKIFFLRDSHDPDDLEFEMFPVHCVEGTEETHVIEELAKFEGVHILKKRYSCFYGTDLDQRLAEIQFEKIIICGVCTDICVMHTVSDARNRDYSVEVPVDCVATFDTESHSYALNHIEGVLGAKLVNETAHTTA